MIDATMLLLVGGAFATPMLFEQAAAAGVPVQAYVTGGQAAAMGVLNSQIAGAAPPSSDTPDTTLKQAYSRFLVVRRQLQAQASISLTDLFAVRDAFVNAAKAGYDASTEPYQVATSGTCGGLAIAAQAGFGDPTGGAGPAIRSKCWDELPDDGLTDLGTAVQVVRNDSVQMIAYVEGSTEPKPYLDHIGDVALAMDQQGYRVQGPALTVSAGSALGAAGDFWKNAAGKGLEWILAEGAAVLGKLALSTPGLIIIGGVMIWLVRR